MMIHDEDPSDKYRYGNKKFIKILSEWSFFHLIIADDDDDDLEFFEKAFSEVAPDFTISKARSSEDLLKKLLDSKVLPDLVILDLNMPGKNGFETLQEIRFNARLSLLPVMIYSTTANKEQVHKTYELGANMYLQKPHNLDGIKTLIKKILSLDPVLYVPQAKKEEFLYKVS